MATNVPRMVKVLVAVVAHQEVLLERVDGLQRIGIPVRVLLFQDQEGFNN